MKLRFKYLVGLLLISLLTSCAVQSTSESTGKINIVASTTLVGDVVKQIGGDRINLTVLIPVGADPHTFEPRPQDVAAISEAQIIFLNGLELEHSLEPVLEANAQGEIIEVSQGIEVLPFEGHDQEESDHEHAVGDPHTWMDPNNVMVWVNNISTALSESDSENAAYYQDNATVYAQQLVDLDNWIKAKVEEIPQQNRKMVTDHESFGYFISRYGFERVGLVVSSLSTNASPSAQELAALEDSIRAQSVPAIFVGSTVNPALAEQVAQDTGIKLLKLYTGSLSEQEGPAGNYLDFMKTNVQTIVEGLK